MQQLSINQIKIGKPIEFDCFDEHGVLLFRKGLIIDSQRTIERVIERGLFANFAVAAPASASVANKSNNLLVGAWSEIGAEKPTSPFHQFNQLYSQLKHLFSRLNCRMDTELKTLRHEFAELVTSIANSAQKLCETDANAAIGILHLDQREHYPVAHALHRAIVCELVGKRHGFTDDERTNIICAALTCDISMLDLQEELTKQSAPLTPEQQAMIKKHPTESAKLLLALGITDKAWITTVNQHHENLSESGYPRSIPGEAVTQWSRLVMLADSYTAMITSRNYRAAFTSHIAMRTLFIKRGSIIDEHLMVLFVKEFGMYPPGTFVKLTNGETAIVVRRSKDSKAPLVKSVVGPRGAPIIRPILRDTQTKEYAIRETVEQDSIVQINMHQLWDYSGV